MGRRRLGLLFDFRVFLADRPMVGSIFLSLDVDVAGDSFLGFFGGCSKFGDPRNRLSPSRGSGGE